MTRGTEHDLMRLLAGELPESEARQLRARLRSEPELAADFERLEKAWTGLALPEPAPLPPGFSGRIMARVKSESPGLSWAAAPAWVRAAAAGALLAGAALGLGLGRSLPKSEEISPAPQVSDVDEDALSLAESYWTVVDEETRR
jgi:anti-sigma factor RsiW